METRSGKSDPRRLSYSNSLFKFPFVDTFGSVREALQFQAEIPNFVDLAPAMQRRAASEVYRDLCLGSSRLKIGDIVRGLQVALRFCLESS